MVSQEEFVSRLAFQQNQRILVLSVLSAVFLPLTFLTGLMGMNVGGIPGAETTLGFIGASALLVALGALIAVYFRRRKWF